MANELKEQGNKAYNEKNFDEVWKLTRPDRLENCSKCLQIYDIIGHRHVHTRYWFIFEDKRSPWIAILRKQSSIVFATRRLRICRWRLY